jgi:hypothetical protein
MQMALSLSTRAMMLQREALAPAWGIGGYPAGDRSSSWSLGLCGFYVRTTWCRPSAGLHLGRTSDCTRFHLMEGREILYIPSADFCSFFGCLGWRDFI